MGASVVPRSTCQELARHYREQPTAVAIRNGQTECTYRSLAIHVMQFLDALAALGLQRGQVVGVESSDRFLHLIVLLACEALGTATLSLASFELEPPLNLGRFCDRILVSEAASEAPSDKTFVMTQDWILGALTAPVGEERLTALEQGPDPNSIVRLIKSSGTTGFPKVMGETYAVRQKAIENILVPAAGRIATDANYLCLYNYSVRGSHLRALLTLQLGGTIHLGSLSDAPRLFSAGTINFAYFLTGDLEKLLRTIPAEGGPFDVHVDVIGSLVSPGLRQEAARRLTTRLCINYGGKEVHQVSVVGAKNVGALFPDVRIMIVDDHGKALLIGERGIIRIQSNRMPDGYIDAPEETAAAFIDGWYHSNDFGYQPSARELVVLGRADDMLNIGGVKIAPGPLIEQLKAIDGIQDASVASIVDPADGQCLLIAVETGSPDAATDFQSMITKVVQQYASAYVLLPMTAFPRTHTGKIRRAGIMEAYRRSVSDAAGQP
jgi:acyl-CoA synthetase (AMP-forming)/AMP-acid ligase II